MKNKDLKEHGKFIEYTNIICSQSLASALVVFSNEFNFRNNKMYAYYIVKFLCTSTQLPAIREVSGKAELTERFWTE
jgi:hypothetical protein